MKRLIYILTLTLFASLAWPQTAHAESTRTERRLVAEGNKRYAERKFVEAASLYEEAIKENAGSSSARYNLGLAQIRQVANPTDTTSKTRRILDRARQNLSAVASQAKDKPGLASKANYNLGNLEFNQKQYEKAILYYKQALRINPADEAARKNLRIAQKQFDQQNKDKNKNQNQDKNKDKDKDKDKQNKQDQQNQQNQQKQDKQEQKQDQNNQINQQTADRIMQSIDNRENQIRARIQKANKGDKSVGGGSRSKRW